jgi:hypothetical protein
VGVSEHRYSGIQAARRYFVTRRYFVKGGAYPNSLAAML